LEKKDREKVGPLDLAFGVVNEATLTPCVIMELEANMIMFLYCVSNLD
jgi:hypothetical protein